MDVLLVEDEQDTREELMDLVMGWGHNCNAAACAEEALLYMRSGSNVDALIFDINMPGTTGLDMLQYVRDEVSLGGEKIKAICMTGEQDAHLVQTAVRAGVSDFQFKPLDPTALKASLRKLDLELKKAESQVSEIAALRAELEMKAQLAEELSSELCDAQKESLICLAYTAEHKDATTGAHLNRISAYARRMGELLGWSEERCSAIELAAPLHDVGKVAIPDSILCKKGPLSEAEYEHMKQHTVLGAEILSRSHNPVMRLGAKIALFHHERHDGTGYPRGLSGSQIPIEASVVALVDVYDALRATRPYKDPLAHASAIDIICNGDSRTSMSHFNPEVLSVFLHHHHDFEEIYHKFTAPKRQPTADMADAAAYTGGKSSGVVQLVQPGA